MSQNIEGINLARKRNILFQLPKWAKYKSRKFICVYVCIYLCLFLFFFVLLLDLSESNLKCSTRVWRVCITSLYNIQDTITGSKLFQSLVEELFLEYVMIDMK